jgi:hypothetical protein
VLVHTAAQVKPNRDPAAVALISLLECVGEAVSAVASAASNKAIRAGEPLPIMGEVVLPLNLLTEHRNAPQAARPPGRRGVTARVSQLG